MKQEDLEYLKGYVGGFSKAFLKMQGVVDDDFLMKKLYNLQQTLNETLRQEITGSKKWSDKGAIVKSGNSKRYDLQERHTEALESIAFNIESYKSDTDTVTLSLADKGKAKEILEWLAKE